MAFSWRGRNVQEENFRVIILCVHLVSLIDVVRFDRLLQATICLRQVHLLTSKILWVIYGKHSNVVKNLLHSTTSLRAAWSVIHWCSCLRRHRINVFVKSHASSFCSTFRIEPPADKYRLFVDNYRGIAGEKHVFTAERWLARTYDLKCKFANAVILAKVLKGFLTDTAAFFQIRQNNPRQFLHCHKT